MSWFSVHCDGCIGFIFHSYIKVCYSRWKDSSLSRVYVTNSEILIWEKDRSFCWSFQREEKTFIYVKNCTWFDFWSSFIKIWDLVELHEVFLALINNIRINNYEVIIYILMKNYETIQERIGLQFYRLPLSSQRRYYK